MARNPHTRPVGAALQPIEVILTIHPDVTVTGTIGGTDLTDARIAYNRTWFGKLMRFNSENLIQGVLAKVVRVSKHVAGTQFAIPLELGDGSLRGSLFLGGQPMRLTLTRD